MIDVKDIEKIELKENELLLISFSSTIPVTDIENYIEQLKTVLPESWQGKIIITTDSVKFTKITEEKVG